MNNLTPEQQKDCLERITKANAEIKAICDKYEVEPVPLSVNLGMGDTKYKGIETPLPLNELVKNENYKEVK